MYTLQFISGGIHDSLSMNYRMANIDHAESVAHYTLKALHGSCYTQCHVFLDDVFIKTIEAIIKFETKR